MRVLALPIIAIVSLMTFAVPASAAKALSAQPAKPTDGSVSLPITEGAKVRKRIVIADRRRRFRPRHPRRRHFRERDFGRFMGGVAAGIAGAIILEELRRSEYHREYYCDRWEWECDERDSRYACRQYDRYCDD